MAIWKEQTSPKKDTITMTPEPVAARAIDTPSDTAKGYDSLRPETPRRDASREAIESVIASSITIEGKIEGAGHIRLAGRFKGDVNIQGDLTVEPDAKLTGSVKANT